MPVLMMPGTSNAEQEDRRFCELLRYCKLDIRSYSGRGMFSKECVGIDTDLETSQLLLGILDGLAKWQAGTADDSKMIRYAWKHCKTDNMGMGFIVYFPEIGFYPEKEENI